MNSTSLDLFFSETTPLPLFSKSLVSLAAVAFFTLVHKACQRARIGEWFVVKDDEKYGTFNQKLESFNFEMASTTFCILSMLVSFGFNHFVQNNPTSPYVAHYLSDSLSGYSRFVEIFLLFITGYFLWDTGYQIVHCTKKLVPFLIHGFSCFLAFALLVYYRKLRFGLMFITFEFSVIFLKAMTLLSLSGHYGSLAYNFAAVMMAITFSYYRIYLGFAYYLLDFINGLDVTFAAKEISIEVYYTGWACIVSLYGLNIMWFKAIVCKIASPFFSSVGKKEKIV